MGSEEKRGEKPLLPISVPSEGAAGDTGGWRTERPELDREGCTGCLICWMYCPESSIERRGEGVKIDLKYCKGCGICAEECPVDAIEMKEEGE